VKPFEFITSNSISHAAALLEGQGASIIAGGTDLLGEIKESVIRPEKLVSLTGLSDMQGIEAASGGLRIGAMTTLADIESYPDVIHSYPVLAQAVASVATPQIRNVGTLGGNLCQRPRCWYYRSPLFDCRKKGGAICFAVEGNSKFHAILGGADCYIVHPSDTAVALVSLKAEATIASRNGSRTLPLEEFFVGPDKNILAENVLEPGEILASVLVPITSAGHRSIYLKAKERQAMDFALSSVALAVEVENGIVRDARITFGGVAPIPYRVPHAEEAMRGKSVSDVAPDKIGQLAVRGAMPLKDNAYKVRLAASLVSRAVRTLLPINSA
jgi:xanthine dehydrogenase YagS FAD-binding subunit